MKLFTFRIIRSLRYWSVWREKVRVSRAIRVFKCWFYLCTPFEAFLFSGKHVGKEKNIIYVTVYSKSCKRVLKLNSVNRRI